MLGQLKTKTIYILKAIAKAVWSHRALYAGLAAASGGVCMGFEPELMKQIIAGCYVGLLVKG